MTTEQSTQTTSSATIASGAYFVRLNGNAPASAFPKSVRAASAQDGGFSIEVAVKATAAAGEINETGIKRLKAALKVLDAMGAAYSMDNSMANRRHSEVQEFRTAYGV